MKQVPILIPAAGLVRLALVRRAPALLAPALLAPALLAACSGSPSSAAAGGPPTTAGPASSQAVAYSHCMRSHGVPDFPDPASNGGIPKTSAQALGVSSSSFQAAQGACEQLLPSATSFQQQAQQCLQAGDCPQALVQQMLTADRRFAGCMRSHGVPNWPDPTLDAEGRPGFNLVPVGITHAATHSPPISNKLAECSRLDPASVGLESN
jgi:hypothetical protein